MKHSIIAVGIFSLLVAGQVAAHPEQDGTGYSESIGDSTLSSLVVQPAKVIAMEKEFSTREGVKQISKHSREPLDDSYDDFPASWSESY